MKFAQDTIDAIAKQAKLNGIDPDAVPGMIRAMEQIADVIDPSFQNTDEQSSKRYRADRKAWAELLQKHANAVEKRLDSARKLSVMNYGETEALVTLSRHLREANELLAFTVKKAKPGYHGRWVGKNIFAKRMIAAWTDAGGEVKINPHSHFMLCVKDVVGEMFRDGKNDHLRGWGVSSLEPPVSLFKDGEGQLRYPVE